MLTKDFTGIYDYEREEAEYAAAALLDDKSSGYHRNQIEFNAAIDKELAHWSLVFNDSPENFAEFKKYFFAIINAGIERE